ncbi:Dolichyl-phosphate-mannose-protein mannosyltransferase [Aquisphaera giovannonii]|uniref:Dolichyl-phosphate-mannose-protein mannosyltransferase n=1 Tax=Aquisphaera giovannonii TaxID=406548 RepID=A0A5B9W1T3_9BACT|nr:glycosyltransferase family 39 protein [Aquisphaera giovannonii]QEH34217.1 Dolichyl-phosphate-mannose-protein mannosyltransferase [Aquisphaera giovannonii]
MRVTRRIRWLLARPLQAGRVPSRAGKSLATLACLLLLLGVLLSLALGHWRSTPGPFIQRMTMNGHWLRVPGPATHAAYFRRHVRLSGPVKHAWVVVAPREGFEICVNRNPCGRWYLWRPTRPFQTGLSEGGQLLNASPPTLALNFPREYQWSSHRNDWMPVVLDVTQHFRPGRNVVTLELESRSAPAMVKLDGEILLWSGERIRLDTDSEWLAEPVPPFDIRHDWTEPDYSDSSWRPAVDATLSGESPGDLHFQSFDRRLLTTPFEGSWVRSPEARPSDAVWYEIDWDLRGAPDDAWIRVATNRTFDLFVNDRRVMLPLLGNPDLDSGDWLLGTPRAADLPAAPELLDPDEVGSLFVGDRFESPRHGDPSSSVYKDRWAKEKQWNKTRDKPWATHRSDLPGTYDPIKEEGQDVMEHEPVPPQPEYHEPKALGRDRAIGGLLGYNIRSMVHPGRNRIAVRLVPPLSPDGYSWAPQLALDGGAIFRDGATASIASGPGSCVLCRTQGPSGEFSATVPAERSGPARVIGNRWPTTVYRGIAHDPSLILRQKLGWVVASLLGSALVAGVMLGLEWRRLRREGQEPWAALDQAARGLSRFLLPPLAILFAALLTEASWAERHEAILFRLPRVWPFILLGTAASPALLCAPIRAAGARLARLPGTRAWAPLLGTVLVLCGVLRIYKLDFQPLDDDEYASCQAVLGIAEVGAPKFVPEGVYYTRSPAYHYLVGASVWAFGGNIWAMRLPCAAFGVATALLVYRMAVRLLHRPWIGLGATLLFTLHPFAIFSAHLVRFYQQQQFFALLAVYWFCEGFLWSPSQRYRYLTVVAFFLAVISQEITAIMAFQLLLGLLWFGRDAGWRCNIKLGIAGAIAVGFIVLDLLVFQTRCLTRVEGVSPNVEAAIKPHFWDPYNLVSLFLGYSRLHVGPSLVMVIALPLLVVRGGRVVWALLFFMLTGTLLTNLMISHVSLRYQYWMITIWLLVSVCGLALLAERIAAWTRVRGEADPAGVAAVLASPIFVAFLLAWSPWRIVDSYDCKILNDSTGAFRFVRGQLRPGDAIAANEPHPHAAYLEAGRVDYDLTVPLLQDFVMLSKGRLIDRNGGAEVIASLDDLIEACRRHDRLWVVVNREKFRTRGKNIRWEYPAARIELFLRKNCQIAFRSYLWTVYVWDASRGQYENFREH